MNGQPSPMRALAADPKEDGVRGVRHAEPRPDLRDPRCPSMRECRLFRSKQALPCPPPRCVPHREARGTRGSRRFVIGKDACDCCCRTDKAAPVLPAPVPGACLLRERQRPHRSRRNPVPPAGKRPGFSAVFLPRPRRGLCSRRRNPRVPPRWRMRAQTPVRVAFHIERDRRVPRVLNVTFGWHRTSGPRVTRMCSRISLRASTAPEIHGTRTLPVNPCHQYRSACLY